MKTSKLSVYCAVIAIFSIGGAGLFSMSSFAWEMDLEVSQADSPADNEAVNEISAAAVSTQSMGVSIGFDTSQEVQRTQISDVKINGVQITTPIAPNTSVDIALDYLIYYETCPLCIRQILVGFAGEARQECIFNGIVGPVGSPTTGSANFTLTTPSTAGSYALAFFTTAFFNCADALAGGGALPEEGGRYFGVVSVE